MKLHVGCGTKKLPGWINIDAVKAANPDVVHDLSQPLPYADLCADELFASGVLEHFDKYMRYLVFGDWARVLKVGGTITVEVPDFEKMVSRRLLKKFFQFDDFTDTFFGENMWESQIYIGHYGNHKWGYSKASLTAFAKKFGVEPVKVETKGLSLKFKGRKTRHVTSEEMDQWLIHSHNNKFGANSSALPFSVVRQKIKEFQK